MGKTFTVDISSLSEYTTASNELALVTGEFIDWIGKMQAGKDSRVMTKKRVQHIRRCLLVLKKRIPPLQRMLAELVKSGAFDRSSEEKRYSFTK